MSPRERVDRDRVRRFLEELARRFHRPARIFLVGGTTLVFEGLRDTTLDIDLTLDVSREDHARLIEAIKALKEELAVNVEEAHPGDFIPLPAGHENRHLYVGRFGSIEVFHFDPYSTALSKIERGRTQDLEDVLRLLRTGTIQWASLDAQFREILPRFGTESLKQDPEEFQANFIELERQWLDAPAG